MHQRCVGMVVAAMAVGCTGGGSAPVFETLLDDGFTTYPYGWSWEGGGGPVADTMFGYPAPSAFVRGNYVSPPDTFSFESQLLDARVTSYLQNNQTFGEQYAVFEVADNFEIPRRSNDRFAYVAYRLINNRQANVPIAGYPAGNTAEIHCGFGSAAPVQVPVPYEDGAVAYDLFVTMDSQGARCGYDTTTVTSTAMTSVTGVYRLVLSATYDSDAWFDNLLMRRAD